MSKKMEQNLIVGLDIGTSKVVAIVGEITPDNEIEIIALFQNSVRLSWIEHIEKKHPVLRTVSSQTEAWALGRT